MIEKDVLFEPVITDSAGAPRELEKSGILHSVLYHAHPIKNLKKI